MYWTNDEEFILVKNTVDKIILDNKKTNVDAFQDTPSSFNLLTPGDNQNLNESNIS